MGNFPNHAGLARILMRRKAYAFSVTGSVCFLILCIVWALGVSGFSTNSKIAVHVGSSPEAPAKFEALLADAISQSTTDWQLASLLDETSQHNHSTNFSADSRRYESIRELITVGCSSVDQKGIVNVELSLRGNGTQGERRLVELLTDRVSEFLVDTTQQVVAESSRQKVAGRIHQLEQQLTFLDEKLKSAKGAISGLNPEETGFTPFRNAAHTTKSANAINDVDQYLGSLDTNPLRESILALKAEQSLVGRQSTATHSTTRPVVSMAPINGVPHSSQLMLLGFISLFVGSVVSWQYVGFEQRGFSSVSALAEKLGLRVIAQIPDLSASSHSVHPVERSMSSIWANRIVEVCGMILLGICVFTVGFCLINTEIRHVFVTNPLHGLTKMVWLFAG